MAIMSRTFLTRVAAVTAWALLPLTAAAQGPSRIATTAATLVASPVFFHGKQVVVRQEVTDERGLTRLASTPKPVYVFWKERGATNGNSEVRGEFWDLGRLERTDPRIASLDLTPMLDASSQGQWPGRDRLFVILNATTAESPLPEDPTLRAIALAPDQYSGHTVTITGRFRGANLYGDLPQPVAKSRWDFVIQSADAAVWIAGLRPRGKGFDLDVTSRVDTRRWLQITGIVRHEGALTWIDGTTLALANAPTETPIEVTLPQAPRESPPQVIFTAPLVNETDVEPTAIVRIQFSRDMDPKSFASHVRVSYAGNVPQGSPAQPPPVTVRYVEGSRGLELKFSAPLDRFRQVRVELTDGILSAIDNQPLAPYTLTFMTGG